jgi:hypothetical protein
MDVQATLNAEAVHCFLTSAVQHEASNATWSYPINLMRFANKAPLLPGFGE